MNTQTKYLTFSQLRVILAGRSRNAIYEDVKRGDLPAPVKLGGKLYWNEAEVLQFLKAGRTTAA